MAVVMPLDQPWATNYERQADDAWHRATGASAAELRALRPPLPQIRWLPPRFGYPTFVERQWTVRQVFGITRAPMAALPPAQSVQNDFQGSDRNTGYDILGMGGQNW